MNILSSGDARPFTNSFCYGVGVLVGAALSLRVSGAHMNPAVTVTLAIRGHFPWRKVAAYLVAQYVGAFLSAAVLYETYWEAIQRFDGGVRSAYGDATSTGGGFATFPGVHVTIYGAFTDQVIGTALLLIGVLSITDDRALAANRQLVPMYLSLLITACCVGYGLNCGAIFNPARDLGPRLFLYLVGYGAKAFE